MNQKHKHVWVKAFSRPQTIQRTSFLWPWFKTGIPQDPTIRMNEFLILPSEKKHDNYIHEDEWMTCLERVGEYLLRKQIVAQEKEFNKCADMIAMISKEVFGKDLTAWENRELIDWFKRYSQAYARYALYAFAPWAVDFVLAPRLFEELKKFNPQKASTWFEVISAPTRQNRMTQQQIDLLKIAVSKNVSKLKQHTQQYFWLPIYNLGDKAWTENDFKKNLEQIKEPRKELKQKEEEFKKRKDAYAKALREIKPTSALRRLIDVVHFYTFLRDERADRWRIQLGLVEPFYIEIARRAKIRPQDAVNMLDEEIIDFLERKTSPSDLVARNVQHAILYRNGRITILTKPEAISKLREQELGSSKKGEVMEVRGMPAYKGIVRGTVRVIRAPQDLKELKPGEILVAHHTSPEFVIAMKRAAAIVTDEGGVTSHAAVVSRELKIPCITATHEGSNIFKTGDKVEVDAEKGVVRRL